MAVGLFGARKADGDLKGGLLKQLLIGIVDIANGSIEAAVAGGELRKASESLHSVATTVAAATEEFSSTAKVIAENAQHVAVQSSDVAQSLDKTVGIMTTVNSQMDMVSSINRQLGEATQNINELIEMIESVAEQTNLLSLNASIEAARAGEHGRGFSVVADEVRKLALQTRSSAETIRTRAKAIKELGEQSSAVVVEANQSVKEAVESVQIVREASQQLDGAVANIQHATQEQQSASSQLAEAVHEVLEQAEGNRRHVDSIAVTFDDILGKVEQQRKLMAEQEIPGKVLYLSKVDHLLWKKKIIDFEFGRIDLKPADISDHTLCRLGKWYYGEGKKVFGAAEAFKAMEGPHRTVHQSALEAVQRRQANPDADISDLRGQLNVASDEVVALLDTLIAQAKA